MKNRRCAFVAAAVVAVCAVAFLCWDRPSAEAEGPVLSLVSVPSAKAPVVASSGVAPALLPSSNQTATVRGTKPYVLVSETRFDKPLRLVAEALGARTIGVRSVRALLIEAGPATRARLVADGRFVSVDEFHPADKIAPALAAAIRGGAKSVEAGIMTLTPEDHRIVLERVIAMGGEVLTGCLNDGGVFRARLPAGCVAELASCGDVRWLELFERPHLTNDLAPESETMNVRSSWLSEANPGGLSGVGQTITTSDSGIDSGDTETMHLDLRDRVVGIRVVDGCSKTDVNGHGTHTAGSIVGNGTMSDGKIRGMAWGAQLWAWFCGVGGSGVRTPNSMDQLFRPDQENFPSYIHSASWGSDTKGSYTSQCISLDQYVWAHPDFLPVFAAGNDGRNGEGTVGSPAAAKNVLTVGATQNLRIGHDGGWGNGDPKVTAVFSSRGPCMDGRIKPDIATPGVGVLSTRSHGVDYSYGNYDDYYAYESGTSMACPLMAGATALVREWLMKPEQGFTDEEPPTAALMKAIVTGGAKDAAVPNNDQGWGRFDLKETLFPSDRAVYLVDRIPFKSDESFSWLVETTNGAPFDVQLVWVDYPGEPGDNGLPKLVNDLDLTVERLDGADAAVLYGNGGTEPDVLNNLESVRIASAEPNQYLVTVNCKNVLFDYEEGGAAALYLRGAFDPAKVTSNLDRVRIAETGKAFVSLDKALQAVQEGQTVEILQPVKLGRSCEVRADCTIVATGGNPMASVVTCAPGAQILIPGGRRVLFSNLAFESGGPVLSVSAGGTAAFAGKIDLGEIVTQDASGVELAGELVLIGDRGLFVRSPESEIGRAFGIWTCDQEIARRCASKFANAGNHRRGGVAAGGGTLVWGNVIDPDVAVAYQKDEGGQTTYYAYLEDALEDITDGTIDVCRPCDFGGQVEIPGTLVLRASADRAQGVEVSLRNPGSGLDGAFFGVTGSLTVKGVKFNGRNLTYAGCRCSAFLVEEGGELIFDDGAEVRNVSFVDEELDGVVAVRFGRLEMRGGSAIRDCRDVTDNIKSVNLCGTFDFAGGEIVGGNLGVYAWPYGPVNVSGSATVADNFDLDGKPFNIGVTEDAILVLANELTGTIGVQVLDGDNALSNTFGIVAADFAAPPPEESASRFVNDYNAGLMGYATDDGRLVWVKAPPAPVDPVARVTSGGETVDFATADEAFAAVAAAGDAVIELLCDVTFSRPVVVSSDVILFSTNRVVLTRAVRSMGSTDFFGADACIRIAEGASLVVSNVVVNGAGNRVLAFKPPLDSGPLFYVQGGELTLDDAIVTNFVGTVNENAAAIRAADATFVMRNGAVVCNCSNPYMYDDSELDGLPSHSGGVLAFNSVLRLQGGEIRDCQGAETGGVCLADDGSVAEISGDMGLWDNYMSSGGEAANLLIATNDAVCLAGDMFPGVSLIYVQESAACANAAPAGRFGHVDSGYRQAADPVSVVTAAACFLHEADDDVGCVVTNADSSIALLVWSKAVRDGVYTDEKGDSFWLVGSPDSDIAVQVPAAVGGLVYNGNAQTGVVEAVGYALSGNVATNAGVYTAVASLRPGYVWSDRSYADKDISWAIAKATYDMSGVVFTNVTYVCDGSVKSNLVDVATLPEGVSVTNYVNNGQTAVGEYVVTAQFGGDPGNYEPIADMTATLKITDAPLPPPGPEPEWKIVTNRPTVIAFKSIERVSDTEWALVITDRVEYCNYRLLWTTDLTRGFTSTGGWEHAVGAAAVPQWTTNVITTGGAWFWRAEGAEGTNMVPPQVEN